MQEENDKIKNYLGGLKESLSSTRYGKQLLDIAAQRNIPFKKAIMFFIAAIVVVGMSIYGMVHGPQVKPLPPAEGIIDTGHIDEGFFKTFPDEPPVKIVIPPPPPPKKLVASNLFTFVTPSPAERSPAQIERDRVNALRRKSGGVVFYDKKHPAEIKVGDLSRMYKDPNTQVDYADQFGVTKIEPSYPVNLERVLTVNNFINAVLITELRSEIVSNKVVAQIESDIYGSQGRMILIPRGSQAVGSYKEITEKGSTRLAVVWSRIITPNGINISILSETTDQKGAAGITGEVDNRFADKYQNALLFSALSAVAQLSVDTGSDAQAAAADAATSEFGTVISEEFRASIDIKPRITVAQGTRVVISPLADIWFKPPKSDGSVDVVRYDASKGGQDEVRKIN